MDKLRPDDAFELGNQFRDAAIALGDWRISHRASLTKAQWDELDEQEIRLLNMASASTPPPSDSSCWIMRWRLFICNPA